MNDLDNSSPNHRIKDAPMQAKASILEKQRFKCSHRSLTPNRSHCGLQKRQEIPPGLLKSLTYRSKVCPGPGSSKWSQRSSKFWPLEPAQRSWISWIRCRVIILVFCTGATRSSGAASGTGSSSRAFAATCPRATCSSGAASGAAPKSPRAPKSGPRGQKDPRREPR